MPDIAVPDITAHIESNFYCNWVAKGKTAKLNKGLQSPLKVSDVEQHIAKLNRHINVHFSKVKPTCISHNGDKTYQILAIPI